MKWRRSIMGKISEVEYIVFDRNVLSDEEVALSYFYKSLLPSNDLFYDEYDRLETKQIKVRTEALSKVKDFNSTKLKDTIMGISSISDRVVLIV